MSAPFNIAPSFLVSPSARQLTVEISRLLAAAYVRATMSNWSIPDMFGISVILPDMSTAILPDAPAPYPGHPTGMDLAVILQNIDVLLKKHGLTDDSASRKAKAPDAIRNMRRRLASGKSGIGNVKTLEALAKQLETTVGELITPQAISAVPIQEKTHLRQFLRAQRDLIDQQLAALDAAEEPAGKRRGRPKRRAAR